jgi:Type I phosphodiesterase / nucleotide pyrophosphatase
VQAEPSPNPPPQIVTAAPMDTVIVSVGWGGLWGVALGFWFLAPAIADSHRLQPEGPRQWMVLLGALTLIFGVLGATLGFVGGLVLSATERLAGGTFRARTWASGLFSGLAVVIAYASQSFAIHWMNFRTFAPPTARADVLGFSVLCVFAFSVLVLLYRTIATRGIQPPPAVLGCTLSALAVSGAVALVTPASAASQSAVDVGPLQRLTSATEDVPLLFIGLDGGSWRLLEPAMKMGHAPTLRRLADRGVTGNVNALWPPYWSGASWASILTGLPRETTGIYEDLAASAPGLPLFQAPLFSTLRLNPFYSVRSILVRAGIVSLTPPPRQLLRGKPVWQLLHEAGVRSAVVRFRFTYPPHGQAHVVVSDWIGQDQWEALSVRRELRTTPVIPEERADELLAPFRSQGPSNPKLFSRLLPGPRPAKPTDVGPDPIRELEIASDIDNRTLDVSETVVRTDPGLPFLAIYIGGLDAVQHAFWQYRFPDDFTTSRPMPANINRLGRVPNEYVRYLDERLRRLLDLYKREPNVMIVSDHGFGPTDFNSFWLGWHSREGIFIASGPSIRETRRSVDVSYYDIVPTIARLKGFREPHLVSGRSVVTDASAPQRD